MKDPYQVLGVARDADQNAIKKAFRKLAKKLHPDLNPGNKKVEQEFKEVNVAYDLLSDPKKRERFDRGEIDASGAERPERSFYRAYAEGGGNTKYRDAEFGGEFSAEDILSELFGRGRSRGGRSTRMAGVRRTCSWRPIVRKRLQCSCSDRSAGPLPHSWRQHLAQRPMPKR